jgi:hypothetical protein
MSMTVVDKAREAHGLGQLTEIPLGGHPSPAASYHFSCVGLALGSGNRQAALAHAQATIRHAPFWWKPYATLALNILPSRATSRLVQLYRRMREPRVSTRRNRRA